MSEADTEALLRRMRDDDVAALDEVLRQHWGALVAYLGRWLGSSDGAEDIAQQTFLRLWERRGQWRAEGSLRALLFSIARNLAVSELRNQGARGRAQARFLQRDPHDPDPREAAALQAAVRHQLGHELELAIGALPERRREIFVLRCIHDLSYAEIASIMGISQQTVANQLSRALTTLRRDLAHLVARE